MWSQPYEPLHCFTEKYMEYYFEQVKGCQAYLRIKTHRELLEIMYFVRSNRGRTRKDIEDLLRIGHTQKLGRPDKSADRVLELVVSLWLILDASFREWKQDQTLTLFIAASLPSKAQNQETWVSNRRSSRNKRESPYRIPTDFNMRTLERIRGISIRWTKVLSEHLIYDFEAGFLALFTFTPFLDGFEGPGDIFPKDLLDETQRTYSLLYPEIPECREFNLEAKKANPDLEAVFQRRTARDFAYRDLRDFPYWQEQLLALKEGFDATKPSGFWRW